jgi:hypothetical protein
MLLSPSYFLYFFSHCSCCYFFCCDSLCLCSHCRSVRASSAVRFASGKSSATSCFFMDWIPFPFQFLFLTYSQIMITWQRNSAKLCIGVLSSINWNVQPRDVLSHWRNELMFPSLKLTFTHCRYVSDFDSHARQKSQGAIPTSAYAVTPDACCLFGDACRRRKVLLACI